MQRSLHNTPTPNPIDHQSAEVCQSKEYRMQH
jgi:hypothetical protein